MLGDILVFTSAVYVCPLQLLIKDVPQTGTAGRISGPTIGCRGHHPPESVKIIVFNKPVTFAFGHLVNLKRYRED